MQDKRARIKYPSRTEYLGDKITATPGVIGLSDTGIINTPGAAQKKTHLQIHKNP